MDWVELCGYRYDIASYYTEEDGTYVPPPGKVEKFFAPFFQKRSASYPALASLNAVPVSASCRSSADGAQRDP